MALVSFVIPITTSVSVLTVSVHSSPFSASAYGLYSMALVAFGMSTWLVLRGKKYTDLEVVRIGGLALAIGWLYAVAGIYVFCGAFTTDEGSLTVLRYSAWAFLSLALIVKVILLRASANWAGAAAITFVVPMSSSVTSLLAVEWSSSMVHPHALGLYVLTMILFLAGFMMYQSVKIYGDTSVSHLATAKALFVLFGLYSIALVWLISDALFESEDVSVSVALLVYTISGLCLYTIGRTMNHVEIRYAGVTLLTGVVGRLLFVDVWRMEILGRIVTFLGVGLLFILTALFEKPFEKFKK